MTNTLSKEELRRIKFSDLPVKEQAAIELERRRRQRSHIPESEKCAASFIYFVLHYVKIYDATEKTWIAFDLWAEQQEVATDLTLEKLIIILKARQLGMTWLVLAYALWLMLFYPAATVLLFSLRDTEAVYLLSDFRLRGMYKRLPSWLMMRNMRDDATQYEWITRTEVTSGGHLWELENGSNARAFPTSAGDSYTATLAIVDEADLVPDLSALLLRVKPTIDGGGQLILLSKSNKKLPLSEFKTIYRAARKGLNGWKAKFLAWWVRPSRTPEWYARQKQDAESRIGGIDDLYENYPATDLEALAPSTLDKRIPFKFLEKVYSECAAEDINGMPLLPGLKVYMPPRPGKKYVIGADPAEGNPNSDDSAVQVVDAATGAQCAVLKGKFDVDVLAQYIEKLAWWYNKAHVLVERNNHGHAVLANLRSSTDKKKLRHSQILCGEDKKQGWFSSKRSKVILYDSLAENISTADCMIFDADTLEQIGSIEGDSLRAPQGLHDDLADAYALAQKARELKPAPVLPPAVSVPRNTATLATSMGTPNRYAEKPIERL